MLGPVYPAVPAWASRGAARSRRRPRGRRVGPASVSLPAVVPWCSSGHGLMGGRVPCPGEAHDVRDYKRLGPCAKLATSYWCVHIGATPPRVCHLSLVLPYPVLRGLSSITSSSPAD